MDKNSAGYTLIELLVVVTIIILLSGLSLAYYNNFTEQQKLKTETKKLIDVLELAKKKAMAGDIGNYSCSQFSGTRVAIFYNNYSLRLCCSFDCSSGYDIQTYNFSSGISADQSGVINFSQLEAKPSGTTNFRVKNTNLTQCVPITVSQASIIEEQTKNNCP